MLYVLLSPFLILFTLFTFLGLILCSLGQTSSAEELQKGNCSILQRCFYEHEREHKTESNKMKVSLSKSDDSKQPPINKNPFFDS